jgi:ribose transport system permease protein
MAQQTSTTADQATRSFAIEVRSLGLVGILLAEMILFSILSPYFLGTKNLLNIGRAVSIQGIAAAGMTIVLISGGFDLSIASVVAASGVLSVMLLQQGMPLIVAVIGGMALGAVVGLFNGTIITRLRINPLIATLGTMTIVRGLAFMATAGLTLTVQSKAFIFLGRGYIMGVPAPFVLMLVVYALVFVVLQYTQFGRYVYAIGGNPAASRLAGINVDGWRLLIYMIVGLAAGLSGVMLASLMGTAMPNAAQGYELEVIAAVILGGASLAGGVGTIQGTLIGMLILGVLANGMILLNVPSYWQMIARGTVLLLAVAADQWRYRGTR